MGSVHLLNSTQPSTPPVDDDMMNAELLRAAENGAVGLFSEALSRISSHTQRTQSALLSQTSPLLKNTFLHVASISGHHGLALFLAERSPALVGRKNRAGDTPFHVAARIGHHLVVQNLLLFVQRLKTIPSSSQACSQGGLEMGYWSPAVNSEGNTALHEAVIHNHNDVVCLFLAEGEYAEHALTLNNDGKSPLYLAVEGGNVLIAGAILGKLADLDNTIWIEKARAGKSAVHAAIVGRNLALLQEIARKAPALVFVKDDGGKDPLHCAASKGFVQGLIFLMKNFNISMFEYDNDGFCPIHLAAKNGHVKAIQELLKEYPNVREFLSEKGQNVLHVAAENGKDNVVKYILKDQRAELLLNERDASGNTPLHLATFNWHTKVVSSLTWDGRVSLKIVNNEGLTAIEVAEKYMQKMAPFKERLTWMALMSAGALRAHIKDRATVKRLEAAKYEPYNMDYCKDRVNTLLLVSVLVATVTFAAGFTMPGGINNSSPNEGRATMVRSVMFQLFVICDSLAIFSSVIVTVTLMWAQLGDLNLLLNSLRSAQRLLGFSLTMMSLSFMAAVDLVVTGLPWLSAAELILGILSLITLLALFVPLFLPYTSKFPVARYISYYPFRLLMVASESYD